MTDETYNRGLLPWLMLYPMIKVEAKGIAVWRAALDDVPDATFLEAMTTLCRHPVDLYPGTSPVTVIRQAVKVITDAQWRQAIQAAIHIRLLSTTLCDACHGTGLIAVRRHAHGIEYYADLRTGVPPVQARCACAVGEAFIGLVPDETTALAQAMKQIGGPPDA